MPVVRSYLDFWLNGKGNMFGRNLYFYPSPISTKMNRFVAILRGINVSEKNRVKMAGLKAVLTEGGFQHVETYIQSGNLAIETREKNQEEIAVSITRIIEEEFGHQVPVIVLNKDELEGIFTGNPFIQTCGLDESKLYVTFLEKEPEADKVQAVTDFRSSPDEIIKGPRAFYLHCPAGYSRTKVNNNFFERKLNMIATTRNWKTLKKLIEMAG